MNTLPEYFKSILWSYSFEDCDPVKMKKTIISQSFNYGSILHWKWIKSFYGDKEIFAVLSSIPETEIHSKTKRLIEVGFNFNNWNYALRSSNK